MRSRGSGAGDRLVGGACVLVAPVSHRRMLATAYMSADGGLGIRGAVIRMLCGRRVGICALTSSAHKGMEE